MSHFSVMIIGENPEEQLEPYWELDLTEEEVRNDPRGEFHSEQDEVDDDWENKTVKMIKLSNGEFCYTWDKRFTTGKLFEQTKEYPADSEKVTLTYKENAQRQGMTKEEFTDNWYGYSKHNGEYGYWNNPNAKWDWYQLGGRWSGYFKLKEGSDGTKGECGVLNSCRTEDKGHADQLLKKDIDLEGMFADAMKKAAERYNEFEEVTKGLDPPPRWDSVRELFPDDIDRARTVYHGHEFIQALQKADMMPWGGEIIDIYFVGQGGREKYIENSKCQCLIPFAFVKDGEWYEKGEMGWWGMVSDEKLQYDWSAKFMELWEDLPEDTLISMYDLHI